MIRRARLVAVVIGLVSIPAAVVAQPATAPDPVITLPPLEVSATPLPGAGVAAPASVLTGSSLEQRRAATLGARILRAETAVVAFATLALAAAGELGGPVTTGEPRGHKT